MKRQFPHHSDEVAIFYTPDIATTSELSREESQHAVRVLRLKVGDRVKVTDGLGRFYYARITAADATATSLLIDEVEHPLATPYPYPHIAIAPTKNIDRIEWLVEKLTEVGVASISLVTTERTVRSRVNLERLERIAISAMKQSQKCVKPLLCVYESLAELLTQSLPTHRYIAHCDASAERHFIHEKLSPGAEAIYLVGPEGDFSPAEVERALEVGFLPVTLGEERLRTETAGLYVGVTHHLINQIHL